MYYLFFGLIALSFGNCSGEKQPNNTKPEVQLESGITGVTKAKVHLKAPASTPAEHVWRYSLGMTIQLDSKTAGIMSGITWRGTSGVDFEVGSDLIIFDRFPDISPGNVSVLTRLHEEVNPKTKQLCFAAKYPIQGGFVPLGVKRADGNAHPHTGTGFGMSTVIGFPKDFSQKRPWRDPDHLQYIQLYQFTYDGKVFRITETERMPSILANDWESVGPGLSPTLPDKDDLLFPMVCQRTKDDYAVSGVIRFKRENEKWSPGVFIPIADSTSEPSIIRDVDGSLLFTARSRDIAVWRSNDGGLTWKQLFHLENFRDKAVPITINRAVDGTPYIATNKPGPGLYRDILAIWPLNEKRTGLKDPVTVRHGPDELGDAPGATDTYGWAFDHPMSATVRLADGRWHNILTYRTIAVAENRVGLTPTPHSGLYVEEVFSKGKSIPMWKF